MRWTRTVTRLGAASIIGIATMASPPAAAGDTKPVLEQPAIRGAPIVGATLTVTVQAAGDPAPTFAYEWFHCAPEKESCKAIPGAKAASYVVSDTYVGRRLAVRVRAENSAGGDTERSELTALVTAAPPQPSPTPAPAPSPSPPPEPGTEPDDPDEPTPFEEPPAPDAPSEPTAALDGDRVPYLRPFPVVRISGTLVAGGARISRLRIRAPATARVVVRCRRSGCRYVSRSLGGRRVRALERMLLAGTRITIRITAPGEIGKHVAIRIRDGRPPKRRDACLLPGSTRPVACPAS